MNIHFYSHTYIYIIDARISLALDFVVGVCLIALTFCPLLSSLLSMFFELICVRDPHTGIVLSPLHYDV